MKNHVAAKHQVGFWSANVYISNLKPGFLVFGEESTSVRN